MPSEADKSGWGKGGEGRGTFIDNEVEEEEHHQGCRVTEQFRVLDRLKKEAWQGPEACQH